MMRAFLGKYFVKNWDVRTFEDPLDFSKALEDERYVPHIVISDFHTPGMTAIDLIRMIKNSQYNIPVLIISGNGSSENKIESINSGAMDFVEKPFNPKELEARLNRVSQFQNRNHYVY